MDDLLIHQSGKILVDMTTSEPSLAKEIYNQAKEVQVHSLDAPGSFTQLVFQSTTNMKAAVSGKDPILFKKGYKSSQRWRCRSKRGQALYNGGGRTECDGTHPPTVPADG